MASPQIENGYTRIANELLEQIIKRKFTVYELSVLWSIIRLTYGYQKKERRISYQDLADLTDISRKHIFEIIKELKKRKVIYRRVSKDGYNLGITKDYDQWGVPPRGDKVSRGQGTLVSPQQGTHIYSIKKRERKLNKTGDDLKNKVLTTIKNYRNKKYQDLGLTSFKEILN